MGIVLVILCAIVAAYVAVKMEGTRLWTGFSAAIWLTIILGIPCALVWFIAGPQGLLLGLLGGLASYAVGKTKRPARGA